MAENKTAKTSADGGAGFIDGVWYGPWYGTAPTCISSKPSKKEWVGLTDEEFKFIASKYSLPTQTGMEYFKDELEAKLKEKNT